MTDIYTTGEYHQRHPTGGAEDAVWKAGHIAALLKDHDLPFDTAVEVGCGSGQILACLEKAFSSAHFCGYDISPGVLPLWEELRGGGASIEFRQEDFLKTQDSFDLLLLIDVFEHIPDYMGFLQAVQPRAKFHVFHIPLELSAQGIIRDVPMRARKDVGHLHYFSRTTALATLKDCGYDVIDVRYTNASLDRAKTRKAKALNFIRRPAHRLVPELTVRLLGGWSLLVLARGSL
jgi:SAM-dependent methyltransferase